MTKHPTAATERRFFRKELKKAQQRIAVLEEELEEARADALDQLNDRAEVVAELSARAAPEGWELVGLRTQNPKGVWRYVTKTPSDRPWYWAAYTAHVQQRDGQCATLAEAVKAAEAVEFPKPKKSKRGKHK